MSVSKCKVVFVISAGAVVGRIIRTWSSFVQNWISRNKQTIQPIEDNGRGWGDREFLTDAVEVPEAHTSAFFSDDMTNEDDS